ncbi:hypothetical protein [Paenibacillus zanthoxyli]|uniref:hypothetical protein n=1 Tax=Paenibacillus zanthoxyli TaxID=369399 RepID=UPI00047162EB|nr:hypothetical protein [Paenibacillus zanthoxyli]
MNTFYRTKPVLKWTAGALIVFLLAAIIPYAGRSAAAEASPGLAGGRVVLDPGFGYRSIWEALANELYKSSPVTAYLPTRLPDSCSSYYDISSRLTQEGYAIQLYRTDKVPSRPRHCPARHRLS